MAISKKAVEAEVIKTCMDLSIQNVDHGCIFVIELSGKKATSYYAKVFQILKGQDCEPLSVLNEADKHIIKHLSRMDGATIISGKGEMREFGVTLKNPSTFFGHGKRHAFALGTSRLSNMVCILASEEDKHVRLFRDGVYLADIDSKSYVPSNIRHKIADVLDEPFARILARNGISTSKLKSNSIPAIITIHGSGITVSHGFDRLKKLF